MILKAIRLLGKASTIAWAAKTGYDVYKTGTTVYKAYTKVRGAKDIINNITGNKTKENSTTIKETKTKRVTRRKP